MFDKLESIEKRYMEVLEELSDANVASDQGRFRKLMKEQSDLAPIVESYRHAFLGCGTFEWFYWLISLAVTVLVAVFGLVVFNKVEKNFIDTV